MAEGAEIRRMPKCDTTMKKKTIDMAARLAV
jgi:hypothetical protein